MMNATWKPLFHVEQDRRPAFWGSPPSRDKIRFYLNVVAAKGSMNGLHLIADLYRCQCPSEVMLDREALEALCVRECRESGLTPLGAYFYQFTHDDGQKAGVTGTVVLAESHLAIHTWPETGDVTVDVYVCNFSQDNSERARRIFWQVLELLQPQDQCCHEVVRGRLPAEV